jgi:hypothetical protein
MGCITDWSSKDADYKHGKDADAMSISVRPSVYMPSEWHNTIL